VYVSDILQECGTHHTPSRPNYFEIRLLLMCKGQCKTIEHDK